MEAFGLQYDLDNERLRVRPPAKTETNLQLPSLYPRAALARALIEARFDLRQASDPARFLTSLTRWFGPAASCLTGIENSLRIRQPGRVMLLGAIQAADHITPIYNNRLLKKISSGENYGALVAAFDYATRNTFGHSSLASSFINSQLRYDPTAVVAEVFDEQRTQDARNNATNRQDWNNERTVLGFQQGTLVLVWLGDLLDHVRPATIGQAGHAHQNWESELLDNLQRGHGAVMLALWSEQGHPVCRLCVLRLLALSAVHRAYLFQSIAGTLAQLIQERHLRNTIARVVAEGYEGDLRAPEWVAFPLLLWWSKDGKPEVLEKIRDGPSGRERLELYWGFSSWLEKEGIPGRAVAITWPLHRQPRKQTGRSIAAGGAVEADVRVEAKARLYLIHLAEAHNVVWPLKGRENPDEVMGRCRCDNAFLKTIKSVGDPWERALRRALPEGYEHLVDWGQGRPGLRLRGPFFVGMKGALSARS